MPRHVPIRDPASRTRLSRLQARPASVNLSIAGSSEDRTVDRSEALGTRVGIASDMGRHDSESDASASLRDAVARSLRASLPSCGRTELPKDMPSRTPGSRDIGTYAVRMTE